MRRLRSVWLWGSRTRRMQVQPQTNDFSQQHLAIWLAHELPRAPAKIFPTQGSGVSFLLALTLQPSTHNIYTRVSQAAGLPSVLQRRATVNRGHQDESVCRKGQFRRLRGYTMFTCLLNLQWPVRSPNEASVPSQHLQRPRTHTHTRTHTTPLSNHKF